MSERLWYYMQGSTQQGPVPESHLRRMVADGQLSPETPVWMAGMPEWLPADRAEGLRGPSVTGERVWYYLQGETQTGPVSSAEFQAMIDRGEIGPQTIVWTEGMAQWTPAGQVPGLAPAQAVQLVQPQGTVHADPVGPAYAAQAPAAQGMAHAAPAGQAVLAPSEVVFLNGEQFASEEGLLAGGNFTLLHNGVKVGYTGLAAAMFQAAFLANEQAGAIRLSIRQKKAMLGLKTVHAVWVEPIGGAPEWPEGSLEQAIVAMLARGPREAADIIYDILRIDSTYPHTLPMIVAMTALNGRGLLSTTEQKKLGLFSVTSFHLAQHTPMVVAAHPTAPVKQMIDSFRSSRPELAAALAESVKSAIGRRREYDNN